MLFSLPEPFFLEGGGVHCTTRSYISLQGNFAWLGPIININVTTNKQPKEGKQHDSGVECYKQEY
jgi:hypothetical protein